MDGINKENMHLMFLQITGNPAITDEEFMKGRPHGDLITNASKVANSEGRVNDGLDMPVPAIMLSQPELAKTDCLWKPQPKSLLARKVSITLINSLRTGKRVEAIKRLMKRPDGIKK